MSPKERRKYWKKFLPLVTAWFEEHGITRCERCASGLFLAFAHRYKQRFIHTLEELLTVALLCSACHEEGELKGHQSNFEMVDDVVQNRVHAGEYLHWVEKTAQNALKRSQSI